MSTTLAAPRSSGPGTGRDPVEIALRSALMIGLLVLIAFFAVQSPLFFTVGNVRNIALSSAVLLVVAVPQALLVIMGYVDLSVGSAVGLAGVITGLLIVDHNTPWYLAALAGILVGIACGLFNGFFVAFTKLSPIIVTLGTLQLFRGITQFLRDNPPAGFGTEMGLLGRGVYLGVPVPVWIALAVFALGAFFLYGTPAGRHVYAIGVNQEASFLSGVAVKRLPLLLYGAIGAAAGLGGLLYAARLDSAPPGTLGVNFELEVLTAVLLGGIAFSGGRGTMVGVLLGVLFLGVLHNGMTLMNVPYYGQAIATGLALIAAAGLDELGQKPSRLRLILRRK
ncbi:ABC transporter permease [Nocardiopsis ansamitocini]|uniref:Ribose ABC transporter permease n=1 Tax=Nocardiopsis ansamitocini TaxID=1670832 RepID=A0A9W6PAY0_9ACTN|nr:ABC transporter permease [Nocardiopsis ansamitocini]GLU50336.1 ribose ABC transporter permease [Nocardiopsis ansamitocini]